MRQCAVPRTTKLVSFKVARSPVLATGCVRLSVCPVLESFGNEGGVMASVAPHNDAPPNKIETAVCIQALRGWHGLPAKTPRDAMRDPAPDQHSSIAYPEALAIFQ